MSIQQQRTAVVIEDDADVRNLLTAILHEAGFATVAAPNGLEGVEAVRQHRPVLTTLDVSMPGIDGFEVARRIRAFSDTYVIMLSARKDEIDTLMGLDAGADDYLTKPFRPRELRARIEAMLRRVGAAHPPGPPEETSAAPAGVTPPAGGAPTDGVGPATTEPFGAPGRESVTEDWLSHNGLRVHAQMRLVEIEGTAIDLTRSEFDLLLLIMEGDRRVVTKDAIALELRRSAPGGYVSDADRRSVEVHMANLRRKLRDPITAPRYVETVRGVGYRLAAPVS